MKEEESFARNLIVHTHVHTVCSNRPLHADTRTQWKQEGGGGRPWLGISAIHVGLPTNTEREEESINKRRERYTGSKAFSIFSPSTICFH